jgi:hypothetical protein
MRVGLVVTIAALVALGMWGYSTTRGSGIPVYNPPYRALFDCGTFGPATSG